jgi:GAF domain-containing protein
VPLVSHGRALGTLNVGRRSADPFTEAEVELLGQVTGQVALAAANSLA